MSKEDKAYIVQLVKQIIHPYFAEEIADILIAHGMTFKVETQTNADHIRGMTDEELAEMLYDIDTRVGNTPLNGWLEWLQQPYKEERHE